VKREYMVGAVALVLAFLASFLWTKNVNKNGISASAQTAGSASGPAAGGQSGGPGSQAAMGSVQATMQKAKDNPNDADAQIAAAKQEYQIGRVPEAIDYLKKAYTADPKNVIAAEGIATLYFEQKKYADSEQWYKNALAIKSGDPNLMTGLGATYIRRDPPDPDKAMQYIQAALKTTPTDVYGLVLEMEVYLLKKDVRSAEDTLGRIKAAAPNDQIVAELQTDMDNLKAGKEVVLPTESSQ
jgi:tetratricopeptide (TPR) repeat protein